MPEVVVAVLGVALSDQVAPVVAEMVAAAPGLMEQPIREAVVAIKAMAAPV
jgi:hypothetical protein